MVMVSILTRSTEDGWMQSAGKGGYGIYIADFVGTVSDVKGLSGKPKIFFINACHKGMKFGIIYLQTAKEKISNK